MWSVSGTAEWKRMEEVSEEGVGEGQAFKVKGREGGRGLSEKRGKMEYMREEEDVYNTARRVTGAGGSGIRELPYSMARPGKITEHPRHTPHDRRRWISPSVSLLDLRALPLSVSFAITR
jgi:hypothetical protein